MRYLRHSQQVAFEFPQERNEFSLIEGGKLGGLTAIEDEMFPFETLSQVAEAESWRKEINRPIYHVHKWWAQRLGTVFRAIVLGTFAPVGDDVVDLFYKRSSLKGRTVFDPFMGSGTTVGEALKLGANAIGRDINPVAHFLVKNALACHAKADVVRIFQEIESDTAGELKQYYQTELPDGSRTDVLYYFWVKEVDCPSCERSVELFSSRIFAQHAYKKRYPRAQSTCPHCGDVNEVRYDATEAHCSSCRAEYDPQEGPAKGQSATCPHCNHTFSISKTIRAKDHPPRHRLYAKLVLLPDGRKAYMPATDYDRRLYQKAEDLLRETQDAYPIVAIEPGYNTNQALGYNYRYWHEMFNSRQLLCLSILGHRIQRINEPAIRDLLMCLLSGALEFNNMFASYKGEGTGAVRHMFAHHVLKPERVPLEANLWGTTKSSGSFSTMFNGRIMRALEYAENPFELKVSGGGTEKVFGLSEKIGYNLAESYAEFTDGRRAYISCGDSSRTDLPPKSVDAVISDPPFFDNVHYSELADFFHVWQRHFLGCHTLETTRSPDEVQSPEVGAFTDRLGAVWAEAHRVLRDDGILAFTYHHSRSEGWCSVLSAIIRGGFQITAVQPIKSEMSVAMPKVQAKEPIDLDIIIVCRKRGGIVPASSANPEESDFLSKATRQANRFTAVGRKLSRNDIRIIIMAQLIKAASVNADETMALEYLQSHTPVVDAHIEVIYSAAEQALKGKQGIQ